MKRAVTGSADGLRELPWTPTKVVKLVATPWWFLSVGETMSMHPCAAVVAA